MAYGVLTIASGQTTSDELNIGGASSGVVIELPAAMTGTSIAIHGSVDGTNFSPIYNDGFALSITFVASSIQVISPSKMLGIDKIRLVSSGAEGATRSFNVTAQRAV